MIVPAGRYYSIKDRSHHGKENHWFYQAASASW
jgi:hypothetical protein